MKDEEEFRTGIFSCGEKDYTFALKNFKFLIMDPSKESINFLPNRESSSLFSDEQGAIWFNLRCALYSNLCPKFQM